MTSDDIERPEGIPGSKTAQGPIGQSGVPAPPPRNHELSAMREAATGGAQAVTQGDLVKAHQIADEIRHASGRRAGFREVAELLAVFDIDRLRDPDRQRILAALCQAGLTVDPSFHGATRNQIVVLALSDEQALTRDVAQRPAQKARASLQDLVKVRVLSPGQVHEQASLSDPAPKQPGAIRWFDIADGRYVTPAALCAALNPLCHEELTVEIADDLLSPDPRPGLKRPHTTSGTEIRLVSAFHVDAQESDDGVADGSLTKAGILVFQPVEFLVGSDFLITCWQETDRYRGSTRIAESDPNVSPALYKEVERCWEAGDLSAPGDLALLILYELSLSFPLAHRQLYAWLDKWEIDFYRSPARIESDTLFEIRAMSALLRDWFAPLNRAGVKEDPHKAWFPDLSEGGKPYITKINDRLDKALKGTRELGAPLRSAYELVQTELAERQRHTDDQLVRTLSIAGAVVLIPSLIAGIAGANTWLPGRGSIAAFAVMLCLMVALSLIAVRAISHSRKRHRESELQLRPQSGIGPRRTPDDETSVDSAG